MSVTDAKHTAEPWTLVETSESIEIYGSDGTLVGEVILDIYPEEREADRANARRIVAAVNACAGVPIEALEKGESIEAAFARGFAGGKVVGRADVEGVVRELVEAADRYLRAMTRESDDDPNCWAEEEYAEEWLRNVLARVRGGGVA